MCLRSFNIKFDFSQINFHTNMPPTAYGQKLDNNWHHASSVVTSAYQICLDLERQLIHQLDSPAPTATIATQELQRNLVNIRILGYLLTTGPSETARTHIAKTILTENNAGPDAVIDKGGYYDQFFIRACKLSPVIVHLRG